ncbi:TIGR03086 family protein [Serinicoccus sp. CNJ-927]|uniref:TIGR03086 family metal-binding protein n=1 Tax=Serinicoccus sp. CNJ-927 TaxID=1904970 RepID=UPI000963DBC5|nr:TIGR03086 family metal-binding protein [Serinicoccus sp. CNJ-927]OLT41840.1 TIGR03086 family protein [Serinicoccus sp. CNJ-927]
MDQTAQRFIERTEQFTQIVSGAQGRWDAPSPCEGWTARDVVAHVVQTQRDFLGQQGFDLGAAPDLGDPAQAWAQHAEQAVSIVRQDGVAEREYAGYFGPTTLGATMADFYGWDLVIHGSDVARATGQPWSVDEEEAAALTAAADGWGAALYSEGICAPAVSVPDDAPPTDRLLARLGRDPGWPTGGQP